MQKKILRRPQIQNQTSFAAALHPLLQRIYTMRGVQNETELERGLTNLIPYSQMLGIDQAVQLLAHALRYDEKILVIGDFDADGATSTTLAVRALKTLGAKHIEFLVPNRFTFGYGLTPEIVEVAYTEFSPDLLVTVDNGIANHAGVDAAKAHGMKVLITDHHLPAETLPAADAIVNPNQGGCTFASKCIAGVGVIFYVMLALRRHLADNNWFAEKNIPEPNMAQFLDLVALGTVADVVALDQNNRILVYQGLRRIRAGLCIPGITALLEIAGRNQARIVASDLGFSVGPRLNAAGRLDDMSFGISCLLSDNLDEAKKIAVTLNQLNEERRLIEQDMQEKALSILAKLAVTKNKEMPAGICLFDSEWHQGVIGILASRIKEKFHRPVIAFALGSESEIKGSARSIPGIHIRDVLAQLATRHPHLITKFGGHAMAAGLTLPLKHYAEFSEKFAVTVAEFLTPAMLENCVVSDGALVKDELNLDLAHILRDAGPWGQSFPEPTFDGTFELLDQRLVGNKHLKMVLGFENLTIDAIAFNINTDVWPNRRASHVYIAYRLDVNEFRGKQTVQLMVEHLESASAKILEGEVQGLEFL